MPRFSVRRMPDENKHADVDTWAERTELARGLCGEKETEFLGGLACRAS